MANIIDRVEQSERVEVNQIHIEQSNFDLAALITKIVKEHSVHDRVIIESSGENILRSDPRLVQHVFENLLDNAAKYSSIDTVVQIKLAAQVMNGCQGIIVQVSNVIGDTGAPDLNKVFTKYYRAKAAHRKPGSGLGLFLVARWVAALGGTVDFTVLDETENLQRATFSVWLPL